MNAVPIPVPAIADFLRSLTPAQYQAWCRSMASHVPVAERDQRGAAAGDVHRGLRATGLPLTEYGCPGDMPDMVLLSILDVFARWHAGTLRTCLHAPHPARPEPVIACAWKPGTLVCAGCLHLLRMPRGSAADKTCDECGRVGATIHSDVHTWGHLVYLIGRCPDCHAGARGGAR